MPTRTHGRERARLAGRLRELREAAGLTGTALAERLGWSQPKISKIETGAQFPSADDVRAWASEVGADAALVDELLGMLGQARAEYTTWREAFRSPNGADARQADIAALEAQASTLGEFSPLVVPGLLQTAEYAREVLSSVPWPTGEGASDEEIGGIVAGRMSRQQILYQPGRRITLVMLEAALYVRLCSPEAMAAQLDRLVAAASLPTLEMGIVPTATRLPVFPDTFALYGDLVIIETLGGELQLADPPEVERYRHYLELLISAAATGQDAVALLQRALDKLRAPRAVRREAP